MKNSRGYTIGVAKDIIEYAGIEMFKEDVWKLRFEGVVVERPDKPKDCYGLIKDEFGIDLLILKDFK